MSISEWVTAADDSDAVSITTMTSTNAGQAYQPLVSVIDKMDHVTD